MKNMNDDLISRQAAIDVMCELIHHLFGGDPKDGIRETMRELEKLPSAQPEVLACGSGELIAQLDGRKESKDESGI